MATIGLLVVDAKGLVAPLPYLPLPILVATFGSYGLFLEREHARTGHPLFEGGGGFDGGTVFGLLLVVLWLAPVFIPPIRKARPSILGALAATGVFGAVTGGLGLIVWLALSALRHNGAG